MPTFHIVQTSLLWLTFFSPRLSQHALLLDELWSDSLNSSHYFSFTGRLLAAGGVTSKTFHSRCSLSIHNLRLSLLSRSLQTLSFIPPTPLNFCIAPEDVVMTVHTNEPRDLYLNHEVYNHWKEPLHIGTLELCNWILIRCLGGAHRVHYLLHESVTPIRVAPGRNPVKNGRELIILNNGIIVEMLDWDLRKDIKKS